MDRERAVRAFRREPTDRIPHCEILSCPDAIQAITGIDPWERPLSAAREMARRYALDFWTMPTSDEPIPKLPDAPAFPEADGRTTVRWGQERSWHWDWGSRFPDVESCLRYDPLSDLDFRWMDPVVLDLSVSEDELVRVFQAEVDRVREANAGLALGYHGFYNTLFMWPLLMFGWENLLEMGALYEDETARLFRDFAEISRKVFRAWARTDIEVIYSHDDICFQRGPVFSPAFYRRHVYPYYEEFWSILKEAGKIVFFVCDGNIDAVVDDVLAAGADGCLSEVYTNWKEYKRKHPDKVLIGGGDSQIVRTNDKEAIRRMVLEMTELGKDMPGYFYCCGNHLPWDMPADGVRWYLDFCAEYGSR